MQQKTDKKKPGKLLERIYILGKGYADNIFSLECPKTYNLADDSVGL